MTHFAWPWQRPRHFTVLTATRVWGRYDAIRTKTPAPTTVSAIATMLPDRKNSVMSDLKHVTRDSGCWESVPDLYE